MKKRSLISPSSLTLLIFIIVVSGHFGCGGGGGGGGVYQESYAIYFNEYCPTPASNSVSFQSKSQGSATASAEIVVTDVSDVYAASLYISFDPSLVSVTCTEGTFLNSDGKETEFLVNSSTPGLLIIGISRKNVAYGVDAVGSEVLLNLAFDTKSSSGFTEITFSNDYLLDSSTPPQEIQGVSWCSGAITVQII